MGRTEYIAMKTAEPSYDQLNYDIKELKVAAKKFGNHALQLVGTGFATSFLQYLAAIAGIYLLVLDRTNWKTNMQTSLLVPYIFLTLPSFLFNLLRGEVGKWIAFVAVVLKLFFTKYYPDWLEMPASSSPPPPSPRFLVGSSSYLFVVMAGQRSNHGKRSHSSSDYTDNGGSKRRNPGDEREPYAPGPDDTVYRYLCPVKKIGSIIGRGGDIVKQLRAESQAKIRIGESMPGCDERVVTIFSTSRESNTYEETGDLICPAQDALFRVHDRVVADEPPAEEDMEEGQQVTIRLLVASDQIGCVIGKGGQIIQGFRSDTGAQIRILKNEHLPACALSSDELLLITGEASVAKKALYLISSKLHENPSKSQHLLTAAMSNMYQSSGPFMAPNAGAPIMGLAPLMGPYGGYKSDASYYPGSRDDSSAKEFSLRLICPTGNIGGVIGKGGAIIKQIRQESGATIKVDSSAAEGEECIISISSKEYFEDVSPTIDAAVRLQPRCSEKNEKDSGSSLYTTRLLVPTSRIGCLIGKGGSIISEMRKITRANIRILSKENLPKIATEDDEMVQISGELEVAREALLQVTTRLKANFFEREGALSSYPPAVPYYPLSLDVPDGSKYGSRDSKSHGRGGYSSYSGGYGGSGDVALSDSYGGYGGSQSGGGYGAYGSYSSGRSGSGGYSGSNPISHGKRHAY